MDVSFKLSIFPSLRPVNFTIAAALPSVTHNRNTDKTHNPEGMKDNMCACVC